MVKNGVGYISIQIRYNQNDYEALLNVVLGQEDLSDQDTGTSSTNNGVVGQNNHLVVQDRVLSHSSDADTVTIVSVSVESWLRSVVLFQNVDGLLRSRVAAELGGFANVVSHGLLDLLQRWRRLVLES